MTNLRAAVISLGSKSSHMVGEALQKHFGSVSMINIKEIEITLGSNQAAQILYQGKPLEQFDCAYVKGSYKYAALASAVTAILSKNTYCPIQEQAFTIVHDKLLTHIALQKVQIATPRTFLAATPLAAKEILKTLTYPVILKFPQGTQGKGVMFADSFAAASSILDALVSLKQPFLIQEYVETNGVDTRALVVGDKVVACMNRIAKADEKRANIHAGGTGQAAQLDSKSQKIAIDTARALNMDICGVDILQSSKGPLVIEANVSPGLQGITAATGIDISGAIAKFLYDATCDFMGRRKKSEPNAEKLVDSVTSQQQIITNVDMRGSRILLPELISKLSQFGDQEEVTIETSKKKIVIRK